MSSNISPIFQSMVYISYISAKLQQDLPTFKFTENKDIVMVFF